MPVQYEDNVFINYPFDQEYKPIFDAMIFTVHDGCRKFGSREHRMKVCIILDKEPYRYQKFISDIAGQDISSHDNDPRKAIEKVRNWLRTASNRANIPGGRKNMRTIHRF